MIKKLDFPRLFFHLLIPLLVGLFNSVFLKDNMKLIYSSLTKPIFSLPSFLFRIIWLILYLLMGTATYEFSRSVSNLKQKREAYVTYGLQLTMNFLWPILFFQFSCYGLAFFLLILLIGILTITIFHFYQVSKKSCYLLAPYLIWCFYAAYLNFFIVLLNQ